jgi:HPt (histidine-containing phosphotransfer) domain-containing protein
MKEVPTVNPGEGVAASALQELRELADGSGDPGQFRELIQLFLTELASGLPSMNRALAEGNTEELARLAHGLKGASASMGATSLASLCRALEETAKNRELHGAARELKRIESEVYIVRETLEKETSS